MIQPKSIAVVHLIWLPYGVDLFKRFIDSYRRFEAGAQHELVLLFNGVTNQEETSNYHGYIQSCGIHYKFIEFEAGQDLDCYFVSAHQLEADFVLFLNSFSVILADQWLKKYAVLLSDDGTGIVGATASLQSYFSSVFQKSPLRWETGKSLAYHVAKYKLFIKATLYWRWLFKPFPNPHIRTNAFMIKRLLFLELKRPNFTNKFSAYRFESGRKGLTCQLLNRGYLALVVGKNGVGYSIPEWRAANTFWIGQQENLLISDNQTTLYNTATREEQKFMSWLAWGKQ